MHHDYARTYGDFPAEEVVMTYEEFNNLISDVVKLARKNSPKILKRSDIVEIARKRADDI